MICCTIFAALLGLLTRPFLALRASPLAWRPVYQEPAEATSPRAASRAASFAHAFAGLLFLIRNEPNMRIHLIAAASAMIAGTAMRIDASEWRWLVLAIALVMLTEALNTAVEQACNAITRDYNPAIKAAKDVAAGAVLIGAIAAGLIGASIFLPHVTQSLRGTNAPWIMPICHG